MTRQRPGFTLIELMTVVALIAVLISLLLPAVQSAREAARRSQCANNLLQLGVALQGYEATHRVLPPGSVDRGGPVVESPTAYQFGWITQLLPYLEAKAVYRNLDFNAGIYAPANLTARSVVLGGLMCPSDSRGGRATPAFGSGLIQPGNLGLTAYAACHNDAEAPIDAGNTGVFFLNSRVRSEEIEDGLAQTIFLGEKSPPGDELGWASGTRATLRNTGTPLNRTVLDPGESFLQVSGAVPEEPQPESAEPQPPPAPAPPVAAGPIRVGGFGSRHPGGSNFAFGDGSVRYLRNTIQDRIYRLLASRADGEPIGDDRF